jgi:membrane associated rhomboid family serine protease
MTPWVRRLIIANVVVFVIQKVLDPTFPFTILLEFVPAYLLERPWTIITYAFLHGSIWHIFFNMFALWVFGPRVEERLGPRSFITLYLISAIGGGLLSFATPTTRMTPIIGASGAIMGVLMAYAKYWPNERFLIYGVIPAPAWLLVSAYVVIDIAGANGLGAQGIANFAHLGGVASGYLYLKWLEFRSPARSWKKKVTAPAPPNIFGGTDTVRRWRDIRLDDLHPVNRDEVLRLLKKIDTDGPSSLTPEERATLNRFSAPRS